MSFLNVRWIILVLCTLIVTESSWGQNGVITYNRKQNWLNIMSKLPYLSQEEKDRMQLTWGKDENTGYDFLLTYNTSGYIYMRKEKEDNYGESWDDGEDDILIRNAESKTTRDIRILLGKKYLVEDDVPRYRWKILNELKEVAGYICMKAETRDTVNNIVVEAWFTDKIPVMLGPEGFSGLPGMILALDFNGDDVNIVATKVELKENLPTLPLPKKIKGKSITYKEYNTKKLKHIQLSVEGKRNPYWEVRY